MSKALDIRIESIPETVTGTLVVLVDEANDYASTVAPLVGEGGEASLRRAVEIEAFKGKVNKTLTVVAPSPALERVILAGTGAPTENKPLKTFELGGAIAGALGKAKSAYLLAVAPGGTPLAPEAVADLALGVRLRLYRFDKYKTKKKDEEEAPSLALTILCADPAAARKALKSRDAIGDGVEIARSLVNEPPNVLFPAEFAKRAASLEKLGVEIEVLGEKELKKLGMRTLLAVGQGSERESQVVIMRWNGAKSGKNAKSPVAFVGKGVTFDTGGISIKPAAGMEDMKGDMAGAACVVGLMQALASRKAKANVIGAIGLVENMPGGNAYRPGDILTSLSGQTIEVVNTDAEGRLVLADVLWYVQETYKPAFMINLATLTGAILVALGHEHAGLFSNNDELAQRLIQAGRETGEKVWRMPLGPEYDKLIDSKFADMKNTGGRHGGSITAGQFLQRFVNGTPWAHLDIAGTGMGSPQSETSKTWASGWGVRLLDRLVADHYETK